MKKLKYLLIALLALTLPLRTRADNFQATWQPSIVDENHGAPTGYNLYTSTVSGAYSSPPYLSTAETTAIITKTIPGKYYAVVVAVNASGESPYSEEAQFEVLAKKPGAPVNLNVVRK